MQNWSAKFLHFAFCNPPSYTSPMQDIQSLFADYASYHRTKGNKAFHRLGIPLIVLSLFGMLARVHWTASYSLDIGGIHTAYGIDAATILIAAATIYYLILEWRPAIPMPLVSLIFYAIGEALPLRVNVALFIPGWIFPFIGHPGDWHNNPAFFRNF